MACGILVPQSEIETGLLSVKAQTPNRWTTNKEFPCDFYFASTAFYRFIPVAISHPMFSCIILHDGHQPRFTINSPDDRHSNFLQIIPWNLFSLFIMISEISVFLYILFIIKLFHTQGKITSKQILKLKSITKLWILIT